MIIPSFSPFMTLLSYPDFKCSMKHQDSNIHKLYSQIYCKAMNTTCQLSNVPCFRFLDLKFDFISLHFIARNKCVYVDTLADNLPWDMLWERGVGQGLGQGGGDTLLPRVVLFTPVGIFYFQCIIYGGLFWVWQLLSGLVPLTSHFPPEHFA